jgi:ATP synthase protein I
MSPKSTPESNDPQVDRQTTTHSDPPHDRRQDLRQHIRRKLARHQKAQQEKNALLFGLGVFGVVGWSVAIPTLLGIALGVWIDKTWPSQYSWTLMLLFVGVILGCLNAWFWIDASHRND